MAGKKYYAYIIENTKKGIVDTWAECQKIVVGKQARFKSFPSKEMAQLWLDGGATYSLKTMAVEPGIYFDSGTGAGNGTEINVTDNKGQSLLHKVLPKAEINPKGHHFAPKGSTNNFGELLACKYALQIALKENIDSIFGDSRLVIEYWSKGYIKKEVGEEKVALANEVKKLRQEFESKKGRIVLISGGANPADLGFHRGS